MFHFSMDQETENEAIDIESIDESAGPASSLLEDTSKSTPTWQETLNHVDNYDIPDDIDVKSKMLIKQMLDEERKYMFGRRKEKHPPKEAAKSKQMSLLYRPTPYKIVRKKSFTFQGHLKHFSFKRKQNHVIKATTKLTHNKRWTEEERKLFHDAVMQYGHRWSKIAEIIGTRTPQQVKSFSRYSLQKEQTGDAPQKGESTEGDSEDIHLKSRLTEHQQPQPLTQEKSSGEQVNIKSGTESDEEEDVDILNDSGEENLPERLDVPSMKQSENTREYSPTNNNNNVKNKEMIDENDSITNRNLHLRVDMSKDCTHILETQTMKTDPLSCSIYTQTASSLKKEHKIQSTEAEVQNEGFDEPIDGPSVSQTSSIQRVFKSSEREGKDPTGMKIPRLKLSCASDVKPQKETTLDRNTITEEERLVHWKFFSNDARVNNPERYLFIRNAILDKWNEQKPKFLSKGVVRNCIRRCDVNLIGSIHDYLSQIGAINFTLSDDLSQELSSMAEVDLSSVTEEEKELHPDFFLPLDKPRNKTPEKYLKIRNFFISAWGDHKPKYVPKTFIRGAIKNCGDVNTVSSIHETLEGLGLINVGVENPYSDITKKRKEQLERRKEAIQATTEEGQSSIRRSQRSRQKPDREEKLPEPKRAKKGPRPKYDPFKLLECFQFTEDNPAPFSVSVEADAVALMDLHAHLSSTEVIGLLGGCYQESHDKLSIQVAKPCKSLSTGMQCEMDPVSQTVAYESIMSSGHQVVGWYHSHPAFLPNPSVRDIETQSEFQGWFSQGGAPFVGMIVSPYQRIKDNVSMINCLIVRQTEAPTGMEDTPFQFEFSTNSENADPLQLLNSAKELMEMFEGYSLRVKMDALYTSKCTYMEKTVFSVCSHYDKDSHKELIRKELTDILLSPEKSQEHRGRLHSEEDATGNDHG